MVVWRLFLYFPSPSILLVRKHLAVQKVETQRQLRCACESESPGFQVFIPESNSEYLGMIPLSKGTREIRFVKDITHTCKNTHPHLFRRKQPGAPIRTRTCWHSPLQWLHRMPNGSSAERKWAQNSAWIYAIFENHNESFWFDCQKEKTFLLLFLFGFFILCLRMIILPHIN